MIAKISSLYHLILFKLSQKLYIKMIISTYINIFLYTKSQQKRLCLRAQPMQLLFGKYKLNIYHCHHYDLCKENDRQTHSKF